MKGVFSAFGLLAVFTALLIFGYVGPTAFVTLVAITLLVSLGVALAPRLKELDLRNLRLVLREIKETKAELYAREEDLQRISYMTLSILSFSTATQGRMGSADSHELQSKWFQKRLNELARNFDFSVNDQRELSKYVDKYNEFDAVMRKRKGLETTDPEHKAITRQLEELASEVDDMLRSDLANDA